MTRTGTVLKLAALSTIFGSGVGVNTGLLLHNPHSPCVGAIRTGRKSDRKVAVPVALIDRKIASAMQTQLISSNDLRWESFLFSHGE